MAGGKKKKGGNNPQKKTVTKVVEKVQRPPQGVRLGKWISEYIRTVVLPHSSNACSIPDDDVRPSEKVLSWGKGSMTCGTTTGQVLFRPGPSNDGSTSASIWQSDNTWAGTAFATSASGINQTNLNVPYLNSQLGTTPDKLQARLVSALLRIKPTSTPLSLNGDVVGVTSRDNQTLVGQNVAAVNNLPESARETVPSLQQKWYTLRYHPLPEESAYSNAPLPGAPIMGFLVTAASNLVFDYEVYQVWEYIGAPASNRVTASHCDPVGLGAFWAALSGKASYFRPTTQSDDAVLSEVLVRTAHEVLEQSCPCPPTSM